MNIHELRKKPHLSVSAINNYIDCGLLYKLSKVDKVYPDFNLDAFAYGNAVHKVLADFNQAKMIGDQYTIDDFIEGFEDRWYQEATDNMRYGKDKNFYVLLEDGIKLFKAFYENMPDNIGNIIAIEEPFQFNIAGVDVPIIGVMDLVEEDESGMLVIADYKTSAKAYSKGQVAKNFQMTVYQMAARANGYADRDILLRFDCLIKTKIPKFAQYFTTRNDNDMRRAEKKIRKVWEGIQKGVFIPNDTNWKCRSCQYKSHCNKWFNDD